MKFTFQRSKIRALRTAHRMTQHQMGRRIGLARQHICAYEKGISTPSVKTLIKLLNEFALPGDYFFASENHHSDNSVRGLAVTENGSEHKHVVWHLEHLMRCEHGQGWHRGRSGE